MHVQNKNSNGGLFWRGYHVDTLDLPLHPVTVESEGLVQDPPLKNITMLVTGILGAGVNPISKFSIDTKNDGPWKMYLISPASKLASLWLSILNFRGGYTVHLPDAHQKYQDSWAESGEELRCHRDSFGSEETVSGHC